jgi:ketosteroid isomerase-like protein
MATREQVEEWLAGYERAWRTPGTAAVSELFAEDASYRMGPYEEPALGLAAIGALWEDEREGPDEAFTMESEILAVEGDTAVVRVEVRYGPPTEAEYRDLWLIRFGADRTCVDFEEWPFWPERGFKAPERGR